jgi:hypothetical protein
MDVKTVFIGARTTIAQRKAVQAFAALQGKTVSQLIDEAIIQKAVRPLRQAVCAEGQVQDGPEAA